MDAHFNEYLAAVAGMVEVYGVPDDGAWAPPTYATGDFPCPQKLQKSSLEVT